MHGIKYMNNDVGYLKKEHICPDCGTKLEVVSCSKVVNSRSSEAKDYDFRLGTVWMVGNIRFVWKELECSHCHRHLTIDEMKAAEGIPPAKKEGNSPLGRILFFVIGVLILIGIGLLKKYL